MIKTQTRRNDKTANKGKGHQIFINGVLYYDKGENYELFVATS
jgi:hypothetical protein